MAGIKTLLGLYPKTQGYEENRIKLENEFNALIEFGSSDEFIHYIELEQFISSAEFKNTKNEISNLKYKGSEEFFKESEYKQILKDKNVKQYFKTSSSDALRQYNEVKKNERLNKFQELQNFVNSAEFVAAKQDKTTYKTSEAHQKFEEYNQLKNDSAIKHYLKFGASKEFANYNNLHDSDKLKKLEELKEYIQSEAFIEKRRYLLLKPKVRWQNSDAYKKLKEFERLKKSKKFKWYFTNKDHKKFDFFRTWQTTFEDDFDTGNLDKNKWLTRYYWAEKMQQESYSLITDKQYYTDGANLEFNGSSIKITTKKEHVEGKSWNPIMGFMPTNFEYTSGIISTGKSFRQRYGLFEAKIKFSDSSDVFNTFWMVGESIVPHINVAEGYKKCSLGIAFDQNNKIIKALGKSRFSSNYHIFSLEWDAAKIVWKINGMIVKTITSNIPDEEMYLNFSAGLYNNAQSRLPATMEIDWVRCYTKN